MSYLREHAPNFLNRLRDEQPNGKVHYRFWQRGGGYDRNVTEPSTLLPMIKYIHDNPVRRGLVARATDWIWSSARFYEGFCDLPLLMDPLALLDGQPTLRGRHAFAAPPAFSERRTAFYLRRLA
ncbi:MAG: hypothetical protein ACJ8FY_05250 [Gemmataceae bacterium]